MTDVLHVTLREHLGTAQARRLRQTGQIPAILYGHQEANVALSIPASEIEAAVRHGGKLVDLKGGVSEKALIRAVQWNPYGNEVLHVDLTRVSEQERVSVMVALELKGEAPGTKQGGMLEHHVFELEIECPAGEIPEKLVAHLKHLQLGESITAGQIELPPQVTLLTPTDMVVVNCHAVGPLVEPELEPTAGPGEPEIIGRKPDEDEEN
jgi:large subunit ribosomal protein L25